MDVKTILRQYSEGIRYFSSPDLSRADLSGADLSGADLRQAILNKSIFQGANLSGADLSGADLSGGCLDNTNLAAATLKGVQGSFTYGGAFFCKTICPEGDIISRPMWQD